MTTDEPDREFKAQTLLHSLRHWAQHRPDDTAFRYLQDGERKEVALTFAQLELRACAVASALRASAKPGDRALLLYPQGLDFIAAFLGCSLAGVIAVPAYPPHRGRLEHALPKLRAIAADCGARVVLTTSATGPALDEALGLCPELTASRRIATDTLSDAEANLERAGDEPAIDPDGIAFLQYTSGSTGTPKGVMVTHANLLHNAECIRGAFQHDDGLVGVGWLPLYHDMGLIGKVLQPLYLGRPCTLMAPLDFLKKPKRWLQAISRYQATTSGGPNFAYDLCARKISAADKGDLDLSSWKVAFVGAEPVRKSTLDRFYEAFASCGFRREAFRPAYGLAENTLMVSGATQGRAVSVVRVKAAALAEGRVEPQKDELARHVDLVGAGGISDDQEVLIVDPQREVGCSEDQVGEIWVRGASVALGYWNRPEESQAVFGARPSGPGAPGAPFLRTGDLGFMRGGQLYVTGRIKDLIILAGKNHYPQDIELSVESCGLGVRVGGAAAFAVEVEVDEQERLAIVAEVEARRFTPENAAQLDELVQAIRRRVALEHDVQPVAIWLLPPGALPKTSSGKVERHRCRDRFEAGSLESLLRWTRGLASEEASPELYVDIDARRRKIDGRHTRYRFDLERDIPWDRVTEPGQYFGASYLEMIGINEAALKQSPEAYDACQWALALSTCTSFITVEKYLVHFTQREAARLGTCRSLDLFQEEELKHIALFRRYADELCRQRPDLAARIQPYLDRCNTAHEVATANASGMDEALFHYQFWLYALVLEEGSIHICDKLVPDGGVVRAAWLATHVAHRREEIQHVATDSVHVRALALSDGERHHLSQMWFRHLANNWGYMHGVYAAHALLQELYPEVSAKAFPSPLTMPPKFLDELLTHRAFSNTRAAAPYLADLAAAGLAHARQDLELSCEARPLVMLPPSASQLAAARPLASLMHDVENEARRSTVKDYLLLRISEVARVTPDEIVPSLHLLDVGIDSVTGAELVGQIERDLGVNVPFSTVFESTIDGLVDHIASSEVSGLAAAS